IQQDSEWLPMMPATPIQPREISSKVTARETMSAPRPPYSSGTSSPNRPSSRMVATSSSGYLPDASHSLATGRICSSTNFRRVSPQRPRPHRQPKSHAALPPLSDLQRLMPPWSAPCLRPGQLDALVLPGPGEADRVPAGVRGDPDREPGGVGLDHLAAADHDA